MIIRIITMIIIIIIIIVIIIITMIAGTIYFKYKVPDDSDKHNDNDKK